VAVVTDSGGPAGALVDGHVLAQPVVVADLDAEAGEFTVPRGRMGRAAVLGRGAERDMRADPVAIPDAALTDDHGVRADDVVRTELDPVADDGRGMDSVGHVAALLLHMVARPAGRLAACCCVALSCVGVAGPSSHVWVTAG